MFTGFNLMARSKLINVDNQKTRIAIYNTQIENLNKTKATDPEYLTKHAKLTAAFLNEGEIFKNNIVELDAGSFIRKFTFCFLLQYGSFFIGIVFIVIFAIINNSVIN